MYFIYFFFLVDATSKLIFKDQTDVSSITVTLEDGTITTSDKFNESGQLVLNGSNGKVVLLDGKSFFCLSSILDLS